MRQSDECQSINEKGFYVENQSEKGGGSKENAEIERENTVKNADFLPCPAQQTEKNGSARKKEGDEKEIRALFRLCAERGIRRWCHVFFPLYSGMRMKPETMPATVRSALRQWKESEPDASVFPTGGIRDTANARGIATRIGDLPAVTYGDLLLIPATFKSPGGDALDSMTPLLRAEKALAREIGRLYSAMGMTPPVGIRSAVGAEREYFLLDRETAMKRPDLRMFGRFLTGRADAWAKGLYCAPPPRRVRSFWREADGVLRGLGIPLQSEHAEAAVSQFETVPFYEPSPLACLHDHLLSTVMDEVAYEHGLYLVFSPKLISGASGSGKHCNWSIEDGNGINLMKKSQNPEDIVLYLLLICAIARSVHDRGDLLFASAASAGNDLRLGSSEAPPRVVSLYCGERIRRALKRFGDGEETGEIARVLWQSDAVKAREKERNRTAPFAFHGGKFEFRMPGADADVAGVVTVLDSVVAHTVSRYADILSEARDTDRAVRDLIREEFYACESVFFEGNGYGEGWRAEAARRGLSVPRSGAECAEILDSERTVGMYEALGVLSRRELSARKRVFAQEYARTVRLWANGTLHIAERDLLPALLKKQKTDAETLRALHGIIPDLRTDGAFAALGETVGLSESLLDRCRAVRETLARTDEDARDPLSEIPDLSDALSALSDAATRCEDVLPDADLPYPRAETVLRSLVTQPGK